ncbi:HTTM domain-containing protein [Leucobacter sp. HNU]|uniref:HTTM domain-containing protein n=1 Tax=Leucobacter sp. HNU TaxID=3236805 RepID=UPI003A80DACF
MPQNTPSTERARDVSESDPPRFLRFLQVLFSGWPTRVIGFVRGAWRSATFWLHGEKHAMYGLAVTRILIGLSGLGLLLANYRTRLYSFGSGSAWNGELREPVSDFPKIWIFSAFHRAMPDDHLYTLLYLVLMLLAMLVIVGWRTKFVLPVYFCLWVGFIEANDMLGDQGDNMYRIVILLLLFTDSAARWSLDARRRRRAGETFRRESVFGQLGTVFHNLAIICLAAQVILVYTSGALFKAGGAPWREGWAVYHPLATARFGTWPILSDVVTTWGPLVAVGTLGSVFLQAAFPFLLLHRATRVIGLLGILGFHLGIAVLMGLPWFSLTMIAVDSIFIRDRTWGGFAERIRRSWEHSSRPSTSEAVLTERPSASTH